MEHHFEVSDPLDAFHRAIGEVSGRHVPTTVLSSRTGEKLGLMPAAEEPMMLSRLLIVPGVEHAMQIIGFDLCLLVLRHKGSIVLQLGVAMNAPRILRRTPPVHISGGRH